MVLIQCQNPACRDWHLIENMVSVTRDEVTTLLCISCVVDICDPAAAAEEVVAAAGS